MLDETKTKLSAHLNTVLCYAANLMRTISENTDTEVETVSCHVTYTNSGGGHHVCFPHTQRREESRADFASRGAAQMIKQAKEHTDAAFDAVKDTDGQGDAR